MFKTIKTSFYLTSFMLIGFLSANQLLASSVCNQACTDQGLIRLEEHVHPAIVETRKISVMGYPNAFNPSLARWKDGWLMSFREKYWAYDQWVSLIGVVPLDRSFCPTMAPQILQTDSIDSADPRLVWVGDALYIVYSDKQRDVHGSPLPVSRMHVARLTEEKWGFKLDQKRGFFDFPGENSCKPEKNWVPFSYKNSLLFAYSIQPHVIFFPSYTCSECFSICRTVSNIVWKWGQLRGGTPAICVNGRYLAFFHSSRLCRSEESDGEESTHYFIGAYTFADREPFALEGISPRPIIGHGFYSGRRYKPFGVPVQAVFPGGLVQDGDYVWLSFGRQDHEIWLAKIHTKTLLDSLIPLSACPYHGDDGSSPCDCDPISD